MQVTADQSSQVDAAGRLKTSKIAIYGAVAVPAAMFGYPIAIWLPPFYSGELGISLAAIASMLFIARMTDIVTDPIVGYLSDHLKGPWGRRKPFVAAGTPVLLIGIVMLFMPSYIWGGVPRSMVSACLVYGHVLRGDPDVSALWCMGCRALARLS